MITVIVAVLGIISVSVIWCCSKIGSDGNWYAEHMVENIPYNDSKK